jgi:hypothetical protein
MITHRGWLNTCNIVKTKVQSEADPQMFSHISPFVEPNRTNKTDGRAYNATVSVFKAK